MKKLVFLTPVERAVLSNRSDPANRFAFDPECFFLRGPHVDAPNDIAARDGVIRGPVGGNADWIGKGATQQTARPIRHFGGFSNVITEVASSRAKGMVRCESSWEKDMAILLDHAPNVVSYRTQPAFFEFRQDDRMRRTCPDFRVDLHSGLPYLLEVKPPEVAQDPVFKERAAAIARAMEQHGFIYGVVSKPLIRRQPRLENIMLLRRNRSEPLSAFVWQHLTKRMAQGRVTIGDLIAESVASKAEIYSAIYRNLLYVDLNSPLNDATEVSA